MNVNVRIRLPINKYLTVAKRLVQASAISLLALTSAQAQIYLDPTQPIEARIADLINNPAYAAILTPQAKVGQMFAYAPAIPALQIPAMMGWNQMAHGCVWNQPTTMFPVNIAMAATFDLNLVNEVGTAIANECRAINNAWKAGLVPNDPQNSSGIPGGGQLSNGLLYRAPVINMGRSPTWGRNQEIWGEDTFLTSQMAIAYISGAQGNDSTYIEIGTTAKHCCAYNNENIPSNRTSYNAIVPDRFLHEYYARQFQNTVEGMPPPFPTVYASYPWQHPQSIMSSYNAINGVPNTINTPLITGILQNGFGFDGIDVPDTGAVGNLVSQFHVYPTTELAAANALLAGEDLDESTFPANLAAAYADGLITLADINTAYTRVLRVRFRLGEFDPPSLVPYTQIPLSVVNSNEPLAYQMGQEAIVLLKNNGFLPLNSANIHSIAVIGPAANVFTSGDYSGQVSNPVTPLQGIQSHVVPGTQVLFTAGVTSFTSTVCNAANIQAAASTASQAQVAVVYVGTNNSVETEGRDRTTINLNPCMDQLVQAVYAANPNTVVVYMNAGPVADIWVQQNIPAIVEGQWDGEQGGNAIADVLFGDYNPGGKLPYTVYMNDAQYPPVTQYDISQGFTYMYINGTPLYPFGHGLSYTQFTYTNLQLSPKEVASNGTLQVSFKVQNTGAVTGDEVAQVYTRYPETIDSGCQCSIVRPIKQLAAFERITLTPGETTTVTLQVPAANLGYYDEGQQAFVVAPGFYPIQVGSSSADIRLTGTYRVE